MTLEGARLQIYPKKFVVYEYFRAQRMLQKVQNMLDNTVNMKFDAHLRNNGDEFDQALLRIKSCSLEKEAIQQKTEKYRFLWDLIS